ncbi:MAG: peptide chain release factor N(5)-glutamine methyltransferase [Phycisphaerales bacterium]|nr:peptide chain release factor N(5)-glutamine methyltransferase [Phycisphaerales bacterium]
MTEAQGTASQSAWTVRRLLAWVADAFTRRGLDSPKLSAEILLSHVLGVDRLKLYTDPEREPSKEQLDELRALVARALKDEPVQYLTGRAWFFGLPFAVDRRVLVPRPCTELMVETVLQRARAVAGAQGAARARGADVRIVDVCTGSGCVGIALAKHLKEALVVATDLSTDAIDVARSNAQRHGVNVDLRQGDLFAALGPRERASFHFVLANPPYIPDAEWPGVPPNVKRHEPDLALRGGPDGLAVVRPLIEQAADWLAPGGTLMVETAARTAQAAFRIAEDADRYADGEVVRDLDGLERFVLVTGR